MSINTSGRAGKIAPASILISVSAIHPLIILAGLVPWKELVDMIIEDLKKTTAKGYWWLGRPIFVRIHLGMYLLQKLYDLTDRAVEYGLHDNAAFQLFCGRNIVTKWHVPDHTKAEEFRSRLSLETQRFIANFLCQHAVKLGFGDPSMTDFDSTAQEANIAYPADANLMSKMAGLGKKVIDFVASKMPQLLPNCLKIDMKAIKKKAQEYFFAPKNRDISLRRQIFQELHQLVKKQLRPLVDACGKMSSTQIKKLPWNIRRAVVQINTYAWRHLLDVGYFIRNQTMKVGKVLSFHAQDVTCIKKGKVHKEKEFGRIFQLGRIRGNFMFVLCCTSLKMNDKQSIVPMLAEHSRLFGENALASLSADKGYWSDKNRGALAQSKVTEDGLQRPINIKSKSSLSPEVQERLRNRRAGIEPLIGHVKHGGQLGRSRMKSDAATLAAGYGSVLGFNLRQLIRHQGGKMKQRA